MSAILAICVAVTFGVSMYMLLGRELKGIAMGVFLLGHAANLCIIAMSGSPIQDGHSGVHLPELETTTQLITTDISHAEHDAAAHGATSKAPPVIVDKYGHDPQPLDNMVDPLPQALILTAIVIGFGVMGFLLALLIITARQARTIDVDELAQVQRSTPSGAH